MMIRRSLAGIGTVLATLVPPVLHAQQSDQETPSAVEEVIVTGYRASLENAADAKRAATNFTDSIFAEDIGKFPDLNIAEALNRIPGIQLTREVNGDGLNIAIRGLDTNFTKTFLNGSQIAVASSGRTDAQNQNRELDLDLFPTELFTQLDVAKSPTASTIEGGLAGSVNMRSIRPFDNPDPGLQLSYQLQGGYGEVSEKYSPRGAFTASWTNDTFGVLIGAAAVSNKSTTEGYETIGWTNPNLSWDQCNITPPDNDPPIPPTSGAGDACATGNGGGGNGWVIPATVPVNAGAGLNANDVIDDEFLLANNPGLSLTQIGEALIPRLSRPAYISGDRDRISGLISFEYRPNEKMHFYLDTLYSDADREFDRLDMDLVGRFGSIIPLNLQVDENNVVTSGTFANAQFFLEARPYHEEVDFYNINPGARFQFNDWIGVDFQVNRSRSVFFREAPTVLVNTPLNQGIVAEYRNAGGNFPTVTTNVDLNDPNLGWTWSGGRLNIQNERRVTETQGAHLDFTLGEPTKNVKFGLAYDDVSRSIRAFDNSARWEDVACRNGLDPDGNSPPADVRAPCNGLNPNSAIPQSELASYLTPGPAGFITVDFDRFMAATDYHRLSATAPEVNSAATGANTGLVIERTTGAYIELNTEASIMERPLRINAGVRYIMTDQTIGGPVTIAGERQEQRLLSDYDAFLPAFNAALDVTDNIVARMSASRTLTRNNPSAMLPNTVFSDPSAQNAAQGNPNLSPFLSTNLDLGAEWYTGGEGFVGLTLFAKQITGFTVLGTNTIPFRQLGIPFESLTDTQQGSINSRGGPDVAQVTVSQQVNAPGKLNLQGLELTWVQPLGQWVEALDGFGFNVNYTRVSQSAEGTGVPAQAIGISPHAFNTTAYYERGPASIRLSYVWNDDQISSGPNQNSIPIAQLRTDARGQLDLSASYEFRNLPTSPQLTLNIINITSEEQRQTFQYDNAAYTFYEPGFQILLGIRGKF